MLFHINWTSLDKERLTSWTKELLLDALNSGRRPHVLALPISVLRLDFGDTPPHFEILEVGDLAGDRFRGIFKLHYSGNATLTLHTDVQANPLAMLGAAAADRRVGYAVPAFGPAAEPFAVPLELCLSEIVLSGIVIVVFSQEKGLTLVCRNDPLEHIKVSLTFDTVSVLADFLQTQIETQIRDVFRETLPSVLYRLSQSWTVKQELPLLERSVNRRKPLAEVNPDGDLVGVFTGAALEEMHAKRSTLLVGSMGLQASHRSSLQQGVARHVHYAVDASVLQGPGVDQALSEVMARQARAYRKDHSEKPRRRVVRKAAPRPATPPVDFAPQNVPSPLRPSMRGPMLTPVPLSPTLSLPNLLASVGLGYANNYFLHAKRPELEGDQEETRRERNQEEARRERRVERRVERLRGLDSDPPPYEHVGVRRLFEKKW